MRHTFRCFEHSAAYATRGMDVDLLAEHSDTRVSVTVLGNFSLRETAASPLRRCSWRDIPFLNLHVSGGTCVMHFRKFHRIGTRNRAAVFIRVPIVLKLATNIDIAAVAIELSIGGRAIDTSSRINRRKQCACRRLHRRPHCRDCGWHAVQTRRRHPAGGLPAQPQHNSRGRHLPAQLRGAPLRCADAPPRPPGQRHLLWRQQRQGGH
jgi:hypothetical protein